MLIRGYTGDILEQLKKSFFILEVFQSSAYEFFSLRLNSLLHIIIL